MRDRLLFVGLNPSPVSVEAGHYHQGELGRHVLEAADAPPGSSRRRPRSRPPTTRSSRPATASLTSSSCPTPRDEATDAALTAGVGPLWQKIALWRPAAVVFIYKRAASIAAGRPLDEPWGQLPGVALGRPAVLPDARPVRADRIGRRGAQPPAQPRRVAPGGPRLGGRAREVGGDLGLVLVIVEARARASSAAGARTPPGARGTRSRAGPRPAGTRCRSD